MLGVAMLSAGLPPQDRPDCAAQVEALALSYEALLEAGTGTWSDLDPRVAQAHRCYGDARTAAHAGLFDYETSILVRQRRFVDAERVFERFFAGYADVAQPHITAYMHLRRGYVYGQLGWTAVALAEYERAAAMVDRLAPRPAARVLRDAGEQYRLVNDLEAAQRYFAAAESLLVRLYPADPALHGAALGVVRLRRAGALLDEGDHGVRTKQAAAAAPLLEQALQLIPATPVEAHHRASALLSLAEVYWARGGPAAALVPIAEAHRLSPWYRGSYPQLLASVWRKEAYTHYLLGRYDAARRAYRAALETAETAGEREEVWRALVGLGEVAEAEAAARPDGDFRPAEAYFRQAVTLVEAIRRTYGTHDWSAAAWESTQEPYRHLTRVLLRQGHAAEAFLVLDETRARYLRDLRTAARLRARLDLAAAERLDGLSTALDSVRQALGSAALSLAERADLQSRETALQQRIDAIIGTSETASQPVTLEAIQRALRPRGQVLLTYFLDDDHPTAFVVRPDTFAAIQLDVTLDTLQARVGRLDPLWASDPDVTPSLEPLRTLYETLYAPVAPFVPEEAPLVFVPDGSLAQVPFGLLLERDGTPFDYVGAPYLLRQHAVAVELAAALIAEPAPPADQPLDLLALGRSQFGGLPSTDRSTPTLANLPNVNEELDHLRHRIGDARFALNEDATEAFLNAHRDEARVIHLASHALVDARLPLYSRVVLWDGPALGDDGILHLYELQSRPLHADLVTLSGCSTARGRSRVGEGMIGLQYAFRAAGARATLATLWQVEDAATAELMDRFYRHLRRGLHKDEALRQAQLGYLDAHPDRYASPFFWASPVLYGDTAPLLLAPAGPPATLWVPIGLLLVLAGVVLPRRRGRAKGRGEGREKG